MNWPLLATLATVGILWTTPVATVGRGIEWQETSPWVPEPGARFANEPGIMVVKRGAIRSRRVFSDFVFGFEFRLTDPASEGAVFVRARFGYDRNERGYRVALTSKTEGENALGRVIGVGAAMKELAFNPLPTSPPVGEWQRAEVRAEREIVTVTVNGVDVASAQTIEEFGGYLAFQARRGEGIEFRNLHITRIPPSREPFGEGIARSSDPDLVLPTKIKAGKPFYPVEPHNTGVQGAVELEVIVNADGSVGDVRVMKSLHPDLDEAAIASARAWLFTPGRKSGQPVAVIIAMEVSFQLKH